MNDISFELNKETTIRSLIFISYLIMKIIWWIQSFDLTNLMIFFSISKSIVILRPRPGILTRYHLCKDFRKIFRILMTCLTFDHFQKVTNLGGSCSPWRLNISMYFSMLIWVLRADQQNDPVLVFTARIIQ